MTLPVGPPLEPMLARLQDDLPEGEGWRYEPKWDGFRAIAFLAADGVRLVSRGSRPLDRYFPEVGPALMEAVGGPAAVDGEIVVATPGGLDFDALLQRIHPARSRVELLARETPATFVAFDLVAVDGRDLRGEPLARRRAELERVLGTAQEDPASVATVPGPRVVLTPQAGDPDTARRWFEGLERVGLDGILAKREDLRYVPGERVMVKVKHRRTADCVVGGYRRSKDGRGVGSLLLGLYDERGVLHHVGFTSAFPAPKRRRLLGLLRPLEGGESFGAGRTPGGPSRWARQRETAWVPVEPRLVCEVEYDHLTGDRFRHAARFLRWRPDRKPESCTFDQLPRRGGG